ncbi:MAG: ABC transporter [Thiotrichales bacterium]|nr:ABC transporter [Thiotrichales bacterium]
MSDPLRIENLFVEGQTPSQEWVPIARDANVEVNPGEIVSLIGESGAGKTTVALAALGYCRPGTRFAGGSVILDGTDLLKLSADQLRDVRGRRIAYVAQSASAALNPRILIGKQLIEGLLVHGVMNAREGHKRIIEQMELLQLPNPEQMVERYPYQISGGQRQRVMIAMAMTCMPDFLVLDEPTTALDVTTQIEVLKAVREVIQEKGTGAIYVSHDLSVVAQVADQIIVMNDGRQIERSATQQMLDAPVEEYTRMLLGAVRLVPKDESQFPAVDTDDSGQNQLLIVDDVYATYERGDFLKPWKPEDDILRSVSCTIREREVVALVGESGSGKSTLARVMAGLLPQRTGDVRYRGNSLPPSVRNRNVDQLRKIQIVFQHPDMTLNPARSIEYAVGRPLELYFGMQRDERRARVEELLTLVDLPASYADRQPSELSGGEKQRVALARAFGAEPELIICDEVLSSLDTLVATTILELLKDLKERLGVAYLFVSHDLATVATIADRVIVMYAGRICEQGPTREVFSPPYHPYTDLLISSVPELRTDWLTDVLKTREGVSAGRGSFPVDAGCAFRTRCPMMIEGVCDTQTPPLRALTENTDHGVYCHHDVTT